MSTDTKRIQRKLNKIDSKVEEERPRILSRTAKNIEKKGIMGKKGILAYQISKLLLR